MIEKDFGFIYLERDEIAYYIASLWRAEISIQNMKRKKYSNEKIDNFFRVLLNQIIERWDGSSQFRITTKGKTPDKCLNRACIESGISYYDLPKEFSVFRSGKYIIEWRKQSHPCKFHKEDKEKYRFVEEIQKFL